MIWTNTFTLTCGGYYGYMHSNNGSANGVSAGDILNREASEWSNLYNGVREKTVTSRWITSPLDTTNHAAISMSGIVR